MKKMMKRKKIVKILGFLFVFLILISVFIFFYYGKDLPRPEKFTERKLSQSTKIYDREGKILLYEIFGEEKREYVSLDLIPECLKWATIVAEDATFYQHLGLNFKAMLRAFLVDLKLKKPIQGGSTISQQLIRSTFLTREKTLERKIKEIILTLELERKYSKDQILEWYLNQVPLGINIYGVEAASQSYFKKPVKNLTLEESAVLAATIRAPSFYSPWGENESELLERKDYILDRMGKLGYITKEEAGKAKEKEINFSETLYPIIAPHFSLYVKDWLIRRYGEDFLTKEGLKVYTTLDRKLQEAARISVAEGAKRNEQYKALNAALIAIDPQSGEVLAMVGSKDWFGEPSPGGCISGSNCLFDPKTNIVFSERQPGSAFKPFVYAAAFKMGYTSNTILWDVPTEFNPNCSASANQEKDVYGLECYHPQNYNEKFKGPVTLREALAQSINLPSVKLLYLTGVQNSVKLAIELGISTLNPLRYYGLSLVLGGGEVELIDMVSAYGVFATEGFKTNPIFVLKIEDSEGNIIYESKQYPRKVLSSQIARQINDILSDNIARTPMFGSRSSLYFEGFDVAAKTGTSDDFRDAWTIGYTPFISVGVWVGNSDNSPMQRKPGAALAAPIFHSFLESVLPRYPKEKFEKPEDLLTGKDVLDGKFDEKNPHSILYYVEKNNPQGNPAEDPTSDSLYYHFEKGIENWILNMF